MSATAKIRRFFPHVVAVLALVCLAIVSTLLWLEVKRRFPVLDPGGYYGSIHGVLRGEAQPTHFYVERLPEGDDLLFFVLRKGWQPQVASAVIRSEGEDSGWLLPITVVGAEAKLKFIGARTGPQSYRGTVIDTERDLEGSWELHAVRTVAKGESGEPELAMLLRQRAELNELERQIQEAEQVVPRQKDDIEKLSQFISERGQVRASAEVKLSSVSDELTKAKQELRARQEQVRKLQERIDISQRVSPAGKLVFLARESLDRDARWAESLLRTSQAETTTGLDAAVAKAERIDAVKREIELEKNKIFLLRYPDQALPGGFALPAREPSADAGVMEGR
jgi:hypothetical protein